MRHACFRNTKILKHAPRMFQKQKDSETCATRAARRSEELEKVSHEPVSSCTSAQKGTSTKSSVRVAPSANDDPIACLYKVLRKGGTKAPDDSHETG